MDIDLPNGKFDLKLSSATLNDNKRFKCHVQAKADRTLSSASTRVVVLGNVLVIFKEIFCLVL